MWRQTICRRIGGRWRAKACLMQSASDSFLMNPTELSWLVTPEKLNEAVKRIVEAAHPRKIILFGSQARGTATEDSDADLMVIEDEVKNTIQESVRLRDVMGDIYFS